MTNKNIIKRLRELEAAHMAQGDIGSSAKQEVVRALPQLLDRLEKLEAVADAAELITYTAIDTSCRVYEVHADDRIRLEDALAALDAKGSD